MNGAVQIPIHDEVARALREDVGDGDLTASLVDDAWGIAHVLCRQSAVLAGQPWFDECFRQIDDSVRLTWQVRDGDTLHPEQIICQIEGRAASILTAERTALNFLQTLSGTATQTARYVQAITGTKACILDTRKTLPGLRRAQKYAVRCGGGHNHRMGLFDAVLIKENHITAAGSIAAVLKRARADFSGVLIEIEVENLEELACALENGAERILLDNFSIEDLHRAVALNAGRAQLEASGGITLTNVREVAETGVDFISIGALTKDVWSVDFSLRFD